MTNRSLLAAALVAGCSTRPPLPSVVAAPATTAPAPSAARWVIPGAEAGATYAEIGVPGGTLMVGEGGMRFLVTASSSSNAPTPLPEAIRDVRRRDDGRYLFVGASGATYVAAEPLGPAAAHHPALPLPAGRAIRAIAAGKRALVALDDAGAAYRSLDEGASWKPVIVAWPSGATAIDLGATRAGEILMGASPQHVVASADDGESFTSVPTLGVGLGGFERGADDRLFLFGAGWPVPYAVLRTGPARLEASPAPTRTSLPARLTSGGDLTSRRHVLVGERHVTFRSKVDAEGRHILQLAVAPLGAYAELTRVAEVPPSSVDVAGQGSVVAVAVPAGKPFAESSTLVMLTRDDGATWATMPFAGSRGAGAGLHVGPSGAIVLAGHCQSDGGEEVCGNFVRAKDGWQRLAAPAEAIEHLLVDTKRNRVLYRAGGEVFSATLDFKAPKPLGKRSFMAWSLDDDGVVWMVGDERAQSLLVDGSPGLDVALPFTAWKVSLAGKRGLAMAKGGLYETDDGGAHWSKVLTPTTEGEVGCTAAGCLVGRYSRLGWDLPSKALPPSSAKTPAPPVAGPAVAPKKSYPTLRCTTAGPWIAAPPAHDLAAPPSAWAGITGDHVVFARGSKVLDVRLPIPEDKSLKTPEGAKTTRVFSFKDAAGLALAEFRFEFAPKGSNALNPVDVEIGWTRFADGKPRHATLKAVAPFRVALTRVDASARVLDDGRLVFLAAGTSPLYLVDPAGKVETWSRPKNFGDTFSHAFLTSGKRLILLREGFDADLAESADGKTWTERTWSAASTFTFGRADGKVWARLDAPQAERLYLAEGVPLDPPSPTPWTASEGACTPTQLADLDVADEAVSGSLEVTIDGAPTTLDLERVHRRVAPSHVACVGASAWSQGNGSLTALTFPHALGQGWLFRQAGTSSARPMSCVATP